MPEGNLVIPDSTRAVAAYRTWRCFPDRDKLELYSDLCSFRWDLHEVNQATCLFNVEPGDDTGHRVPSWNCKCGFYGYKCYQEESLKFARSYPWFYMPTQGYMLVTGVIAGGGKVIEHDIGLRVEMATVVAILGPKKVSDLAKSRVAGSEYALEVVLWEDWVSSTLPSLAEEQGLSVVEEQELQTVLGQHSLDSY